MQAAGHATICTQTGTDSASYMTTEHNGGEEPGHGDSQTHAMGRSDMATHASDNTEMKDKRDTTACGMVGGYATKQCKYVY